MLTRPIVTASILATTALLVGGAVLLAQDASPMPAESPAAASSPMPVESAPAASMSAGTVVAVTLQDGVVTPAVTSIPAGSVTFDVSNTGGLTHEFVVVRNALGRER